MLEVIVVALRVTFVTLVLTGIAYPLAATGLSQVLFPGKANGSLVEHDGHVVGSELLGQVTTNPGYFQPHPSAAGQNGYDPTASSGSNLGPTSKKLQDRIAQDLERLQKENPDATGPVPDELVTASASGLDPHLSPEGARWQIPRIARFRKVAPDRVRAVLDTQMEQRDLWIFGEPRVNVLTLNIALDKQFGQPPAPPAPLPAPAGSAPAGAASAPTAGAPPGAVP